MADAQTKLDEIRQFIDNYIKSTKERGKMHGSIAEIESQWWVLDLIYFLLEDISTNDKNKLDWGAFLSSKGFGAKNAAYIVADMKPADPYLELSKLRTEYEAWRKAKIDKMKVSNQSKT